MIQLNNVGKSFTLHNQGGVKIQVIKNASFSVSANECVALTGESGVGKSSLIRMIYGNYLLETGTILVNGIDISKSSPRGIIKLRQNTLGYVSQFLKTLPRVSTINVVAEPMLKIGLDEKSAINKSAQILTRLNIPERLWPLSPLTFSGGEQQRVNIARGFSIDYPILLLDEPTASLDQKNRTIVTELISESKRRGSAILGIFHDAYTRKTICDREIDVSKFSV